MAKRYFHYHNGRKVFEDTVVPRPITWVIKHEVTMSMQPATNYKVYSVRIDGAKHTCSRWDEVLRHNGTPKVLWKKELLDIQPDLGVEIVSQKSYNKPATRYVVHEDGSIRKL